MNLIMPNDLVLLIIFLVVHAKEAAFTPKAFYGIFQYVAYEQSPPLYSYLSEP